MSGAAGADDGAMACRTSAELLAPVVAVEGHPGRRAPRRLLIKPPLSDQLALRGRNAPSAMSAPHPLSCAPCLRGAGGACASTMVESCASSVRTSQGLPGLTAAPAPALLLINVPDAGPTAIDGCPCSPRAQASSQMHWKVLARMTRPLASSTAPLASQTLG